MKAQLLATKKCDMAAVKRVIDGYGSGRQAERKA